MFTVNTVTGGHHGPWVQRRVWKGVWGVQLGMALDRESANSVFGRLERYCQGRTPSHTHLPENFQEPPFVLCQERYY